MYTCIACGFKVFNEVFSEYEICPICSWQDTNIGMLKPLEAPFEKDKALFEYHQNNLKKFGYSVQEVKIGPRSYLRNPLWRSLEPEDFNSEFDYFPTWKYKEFHDLYPKNSKNHLSLMKNAQEYNPDSKIHN